MVLQPGLWPRSHCRRIRPAVPRYLPTYPHRTPAVGRETVPIIGSRWQPMGLEGILWNMLLVGR